MVGVCGSNWVYLRRRLKERRVNLAISQHPLAFNESLDDTSSNTYLLSRWIEDHWLIDRVANVLQNGRLPSVTSPDHEDAKLIAMFPEIYCLIHVVCIFGVKMDSAAEK